MTTQRDRLTAALLDAHRRDECLEGCALDESAFTWEADALLARGVRVLDAEALAAAVQRAMAPADTELPNEFHRRFAADILAALDEDPQ